MNVDRWLYKEYELYCPQYASITEECYQENEWDLIAILKDGTRIMYDGEQHSIRSLPDSNDISEEQLRIEFSKRVSKILRRRGMSQLELSNLTGISTTTISKYMSRKATPSLYNANRIARALGCSIDELMCIYKD